MTHKIYLQNCIEYEGTEKQLPVWKNTKNIRLNNHRSDEAMFNDYSKMCLLTNFEYYIPLVGDIKGFMRLPIPGGSAWGSRRRLSYSLRTDKKGHPIHFPAVDLFRVQLDDAYNQTIAILEAEYSCKTISQYLAAAGSH